MTTRCITVAILVASPLVAQEETTTLEVGDRVRVVDSTRVVVGTVSWLDSESVRVEGESAEDSAEFSWALSEVETLEISQGESGRAGVGALIGFGAGFALGVAVGSDDPPPCPPPPDYCDNPFCGSCDSAVSFSPVEAGAVLGLVGAGIGAVIGVFAKTEKWEPVELSAAKPIVAIHPSGRFDMGFTIPVRR